MDHPEGCSLAVLETRVYMYAIGERCSAPIASRWLGDLTSPQRHDGTGTTPVDLRVSPGF